MGVKERKLSVALWKGLKKKKNLGYQDVTFATVNSRLKAQSCFVLDC